MSLKMMTVFEEEDMSLEDVLSESFWHPARQGRDLSHTQEPWEVAVVHKRIRSFDDRQPDSDVTAGGALAERARCEARETDEGWVVEFWFADKAYGRYQSPSTLISTRFRRWPSNSA